MTEISRAEGFQTLYLDTPPSITGGENHFPLFRCGLQADLPSRCTPWQGGESKRTMEKPDKHFLSQMTRANINTHKSCCHDAIRMALYSGCGWAHLEPQDSGSRARRVTTSEANLVYIERSRQAWAAEWKPVSRKRETIGKGGKSKKGRKRRKEGRETRRNNPVLP